MILSTIELGRDGNTIMRQMNEADIIQKSAWEQAKRTIIEVFMYNPEDLVEKAESVDRRSLYIRDKEVYRQRVERFDEKVVVMGDWLFTAVMNTAPKEWWTL